MAASADVQAVDPVDFDIVEMTPSPFLEEFSARAGALFSHCSAAEDVSPISNLPPILLKKMFDVAFNVIFVRRTSAFG